jgi:hypothetical protein
MQKKRGKIIHSMSFAAVHINNITECEREHKEAMKIITFINQHLLA